MRVSGPSTYLCGVSIAVTLLGCNDPANDRPAVLAAQYEPEAANDNEAPATDDAATPPPLSGGTLLVSRDGRIAVASDPDGDRVWVTDLTGRASPWAIPLERGAEPGRAVEDGQRRVHVVLRGAAEVLTIDLGGGAGGGLAAGGLVSSEPLRRGVCVSPRGIAWNPSGDALNVVCAGGELVTLPAAGGEPTRRSFVATDLRDVIVSQGLRYVTRFRSAEVLQLDAQDRVIRTTLGAVRAENDDGGDASVAWRALPLARGGVVVLHQRAAEVPLRPVPAGFAADLPCGAGVVQSAVSVVKDDSAPLTSLPLQGAVLAVDVALDGRGEEVAVAAPGGAQQGTQLFRYRFERLYSNVERGCIRGEVMGAAPTARVPGEAVAVAYDPYGRLVVQTREPAAVHVLDTAYDGARTGAVVASVRLATDSFSNAGHRAFHSDTGAGVTCASCHPEGLDDARVWRIDGVGARRTPSLRGGLLATAPFQWEGDARDLQQLAHDSFARQMRVGSVPSGQAASTVRWLDGLPAIARGTAPATAASQRGRAVFEGDGGCAGCHAGERLTNNENRDIGTDGAFQVPSLADVAARGPWLHDGRATSLRDAVLAGERHGSARHLDADRLADLLAYIETL